MAAKHSHDASPAAAGTAESTIDLLARAQRGERDALERLFARFEPELRRFAHGRLPRWARDMTDTPDLVQETLLRTFKQIERFDDRGEGALRAYMRQALMNRIRDELRRAARRPPGQPLSADAPNQEPSPLEAAIGREAVDHFDAALASLNDADRELVIARVELGMSYPEIAACSGRSSANAARMAVVRAILRLTEALGHAPPKARSR
jgi:RNA polymerase sigma factor (sigma-70 family)